MKKIILLLFLTTICNSYEPPSISVPNITFTCHIDQDIGATAFNTAGTFTGTENGQYQGGLESAGIVTGIVGKGLLLDGNNDFIKYTYSATAFNIAASSFTIMGWFRCTNYAANYRVIYSMAGGGAPVYFLIQQTTGKLWNWNGFDTGHVIDLNRWYFYAYTFDRVTATNGTETFYIKRIGVDSKVFKLATRTGTVAAFITTAASTVGVGANPQNLFHFIGNIDEHCLVIGRALTLGEMERYARNMRKSYMVD